MSHLVPKAQAFLDRPLAERRAYIRSDSIKLSYKEANDIWATLEDFINGPVVSRPPGLRVTAITNNGKTYLAETFATRHPPTENPDGEAARVPVLYLQAPPQANEKRLYNSILAKLNIVHTSSDADEKQLQVVQAMRLCGVRLLMIDEAHNMIAGQQQRHRDALTTLRFLTNELKISLALFGIHEAEYAITSDPQLRNRLQPMTLPIWDCNARFVGLLRAIEKRVPLAEPSNLDQGRIPAKIHLRSEGTIGETTKLLKALALAALDRGQERITEELIDTMPWRRPSDPGIPGVGKSK